MRDVPPGFSNPEQVLTFRIGIPAPVIENPMQVMRTHEAIARKLEAIPGVHSVGVSSSITMDGVSSNDPIYIEDSRATTAKCRRCAASNSSAPATSRR